MIRDIIEIDEELCNGCGNCIPGCHEGALQIIDGKARLVSDLMCDGLGACIGHCPQGAMTVVKKDTEAYNEERVMRENIIPAGLNTIKAHLQHLKDHKETGYLEQAFSVLKDVGIEVELEEAPPVFSGCPGSLARKLGDAAPRSADPSVSGKSELTHWPVQLHLLNPDASYLRGADLLLAADCSAYASGSFHNDFLKGKALAIACPKLDEGLDIYRRKLTAMIDEGGLNTITILRMEVPCCGGLLSLVQAALSEAKRKIPVKEIILSSQGIVLQEKWKL